MLEDNETTQLRQSVESTSYQSAKQKGRSGPAKGPQPVAATTRTRLRLPSRKLTIRKVQNKRSQIVSIDLASTSGPEPS